MSNFHFKQFALAHDKSTIKIGTDAVLLGSWAPLSEFKHILDIGCGCGIISLMAAQKSNAQILGIDIDDASIKEAAQNAELSPWKERIVFRNISLQTFTENTNEKFDCIVSNPPFFENSLKPLSPKKNMGKHNELLSLEELSASAKHLLTDNGIFCTILPFTTYTKYIQLCKKLGFFTSKICYIKSFPNKTPQRVLSCLKKEKTIHQIEQLSIRENPNTYSSEYIQLTKDFYLNLQ